MKAKWSRCLPFEEELFDRWEKAEFLGFGDKTSIYQQSYVYGDVKVGNNTWIGPFTILDGSGGLTIGDNCSISSGVQVYSHDSSKWAVSGGKCEYEYAPVSIGSNCFIGPHAVILKGVTIGASSIIGANSVVTCDIPGKSVAFGNPAKVAGNVTVNGCEVKLKYLEED
jgi:acetyltransferase-like isoleucine patch superfamily enzyme